MNNITKFIISRKTQKMSLWDIFAISLIFWIFILIKNGTEYMYAPVPLNLEEPLSLAPQHLPEYALRSTMRLVFGIIASVIFSIIYALIAAKVQRLQKFMISLLDITQSIPILGYISFTITGFIALFPNNILGFELAVIFAAFTCQVFNITYSIYQSIITVPENIQETQKIFKLNSIQKFLLVELPYSIPSLVWNIMISISNSWFFVVASEAIIEGNHSYYLPGIGSYIATAIEAESLKAITYAIITMSIVIIAYDQLIFRPLVEWSNKFKYEYYNPDCTSSWSYKIFNKSRFVGWLNYPFKAAYGYMLTLRLYKGKQKTNVYTHRQKKERKIITQAKNIIWYSLLTALSIYAFYEIFTSLSKDISFVEAKHSMYLGLITTIRIIITTLITILIWLPISIYIGLRPSLVKIAQPLALLMSSFPANLIFPLCVYLIKKYELDPNIWLSILLIISMQWYLIFNILSGISSIPANLSEVVKSFDIKGYKLFKKILFPAIMPHFMIGAITAWGCAWNTTIIAEIAEWGTTTLEATGIGAYVTNASNDGDTSRIILGILVMLIYIEFFNRIFWRPLFKYTDKMEQLK
jgi:NitT/TauT family transport system permease protein